MSTQKSLLQAIHESPLDEKLRLVCADWLEEQGDSPQAELIRLQCEMDHLDKDTAKFAAFEKRTKSLLQKHKRSGSEERRGSCRLSRIEGLLMSNRCKSLSGNTQVNRMFTLVLQY
ncbi:MAG: TIGR02996 domain-containing protein [Gemmataceae bacterium]